MRILEKSADRFQFSISKSYTTMLLATLVWIGIMFYLGTIPRIPQPSSVSPRFISILGHFGPHFVLTFLVYFVLAKSPHRRFSIQMLALTLAISSSLVIGLTIEGIQYFSPDRAAEVSDVVLNTVGAITAAGTVFILEKLKISRTFVSVSTAGFVVSFIALLGASSFVWNPSLPRIGDHWHARYTIAICGQELPPLQGIQAGVHTHGRGLIHIHPRSVDETGKNTNLALFFTNTGGTLTDTRITLPNGETYVNGNLCPDGQPGELFVTVNGENQTEPSSYVMKNRDIISISFK